MKTNKRIHAILAIAVIPDARRAVDRIRQGLDWTRRP